MVRGVKALMFSADYYPCLLYTSGSSPLGPTKIPIWRWISKPKELDFEIWLQKKLEAGLLPLSGQQAKIAQQLLPDLSLIHI